MSQKYCHRMFNSANYEWNGQVLNGLWLLGRDTFQNVIEGTCILCTGIARFVIQPISLVETLGWILPNKRCFPIFYWANPRFVKVTKIFNLPMFSNIFLEKLWNDQFARVIIP